MRGFHYKPLAVDIDEMPVYLHDTVELLSGEHAGKNAELVGSQGGFLFVRELNSDLNKPMAVLPGQIRKIKSGRPEILTQ